MAENTNENPTPQPGSDEYNDQMAALADQQVNQQPSTESQGDAPVATKPDAVPEKFWDAEKGVVNYEAWAESTRNLEQKLSGKSQEEGDDKSTEGDEQQEDLPEGSTLTPEAFSNYSKEFAENGELSEDSYTALEKAGIPRDYVDDYIEGQRARIEMQENNLLNQAGFGGRKEFDSAVEWAKANMSPSDLQAYNDAVASTDIRDVQEALSGLVKSYRTAKGSTESTLLNGDGQPTTSDVYESQQQMIDAMSDPRYRKDPAYRKQVEAKVARSKF